MLPNPTASDNNGNWFFYAAAGIYSVQIYAPTITERDLPDQDVGATGAGTVTSVAMTGDGVIFGTIAGSPITDSGTFDLSSSLLTQLANTFLAGPSSGADAAPTFRALVADDLPDGVGTVTNVALALSLPSFLAAVISGSPVATSGTLTGTVTLATQNENLVFAGPASGSASAPTFRSLVAADIPDLPGSIITSGKIGLAEGGTNVDLSASGSSTNFLAQDGSHVISARGIVIDDLTGIGGVTAGPFTAITSIQVVNGIVTVLTGS